MGVEQFVPTARVQAQAASIGAIVPMGAIVVFGAGGRAGRAGVAGAVRRGHRVTAAVRHPARHAVLPAENVTVVTGDVTDPATCC